MSGTSGTSGYGEESYGMAFGPAPLAGAIRFQNQGGVEIPIGGPLVPMDGGTGWNAGAEAVLLRPPAADNGGVVLINVGAAVAAGAYGMALPLSGPVFVAAVDGFDLRLPYGLKADEGATWRKGHLGAAALADLGNGFALLIATPGIHLMEATTDAVDGVIQGQPLDETLTKVGVETEFVTE